jgi:hypothetical protein
MSLKNPVTPPGIDPGTVRLVAQRLNYYAIPGPFIILYYNIMGPPSYMRSVVDRNVVVRSINVLCLATNHSVSICRSKF